MKRFSLGLLCLVIYAIFSPHYPDSYYLTDEYDVRKPCFCTSIPDAFNITDLKPKPHCHTLFCLTNVTVLSQMRVSPGAAVLVPLCLHPPLGQSHPVQIC